jgi:hypothetical protein
MNEHKIKTLRKQMRKLKTQFMNEFFDGLKDVGFLLRLKVCFKLIFTNFRLFNKKEVTK